MEMYYFAVFRPESSGGYSVWFPDVPEALTQGNDLREAMTMAADVLAISLGEYAKARQPLPAPSSIEEVRHRAEQAETVAATEGVEAPSGELLFPLIAAPDVDATPVRISVSLPKNVLEEIDRKANLAGMTRSGFLSRAAQSYSL